MEALNKTESKGGKKNEAEVPRLPAPPPNPRHKTERLTADPREEVQGHTVEHSSVVEDMSASAELEVSMEEVRPTLKYHIPQDSTSASTEFSQVAMTPQQNNNSGTSQDIPVYYSKQQGSVGVQRDTLQRNPDGSQVIRTNVYQSPERFEDDRPLTKRYQRILKILSIVAAVVFFPTGIPAVYFAFQTEKEFNAGVLRGNIDKARKCAKRGEKFIIFSFLLCVMVVVMVIAIYERSKWTEEEAKANSLHRILPGV